MSKGDRKWVFPKIEVPPNHVLPYKPSILGDPYFWKHPNGSNFAICIICQTRDPGWFPHVRSDDVFVSGVGVKITFQPNARYLGSEGEVFRSLQNMFDTNWRPCLLAVPCWLGKSRTCVGVGWNETSTAHVAECCTAKGWSWQWICFYDGSMGRTVCLPTYLYHKTQPFM